MSKAKNLALIKEWLYYAKDHRYSFTLVVRDDHDGMLFPVHCESSSTCLHYIRHYTGKDDFSVMEAYCIKENIPKQLKKDRCWNTPEGI